MSEILPTPNRLLQRRYLPMKDKHSKSFYDLVWIDDDGSCVPQHASTYTPRFHRYRDAQHRVWAIRCPASLTELEQMAMAKDIPEGSWRKHVTSLGSEKSRRPVEDDVLFSLALAAALWLT